MLEIGTALLVSAVALPFALAFAAKFGQLLRI